MKQPCPEICLAVIWHQHQPYYWELSSNELVFPWVRLHATKDYGDMALRLEGFPKIHQTFNLVPSLLEQLEAYGDGRVTDRYLRHARIPAQELTREQKTFILERFFDAHEENLIRPYARYAELKQRRDAGGVERARGKWSVQDFRDLQTWFNLAWIDPWLRQSDTALRELVAKGRDYSEDEKQAVLDRHLDLIRQVVPIHRRLQDEGRIEVITTPFFHPILPLLCDTNEARVAQSNVRLPSNRFQHPEDARSHIARAVRFYQERFGRKPRGMWPAEGSVSPAAAALFAEASIGWIATDEEVLGCSLGESFKRSASGVPEHAKALYTPYRLRTGAGDVSIVFRDHILSDLIGFQYYRAEPVDAAEDFVSRVERIAQACGEPEGMPRLVSIILDGENCWEFYREDGGPFLENLYQRLSEHPSIRSVTVSEYLDEARDRGSGVPELPRLFSGSWINHNFAIWIGGDEDNRSWDLLWQTRQALGAAAAGEPPPDLDKAWKEMYIAEGSDWNWWYGDEHYTIFAETFDRLYRKHLRNVYCFIGREAPASLDVPIWRGVRPRIARLPGRTFTPAIDGRLSDFYEWCEAGRYCATEAGEAMHVGKTRVHWVYFGFDLERFYLRADFRSQADFPRDAEELAVLVPGEESRRVVHSIGAEAGGVRLERQTGEGWVREAVEAESALDSIWEVAIPWSAVAAAEPGRPVRFFVQILREGAEVERVPRNAALEMIRPSPDYDAGMWMV